MKLKILVSCCFLLLVATTYSQTTSQEVYDNLNKSASVYYAYPRIDECYTPAPAGYKPFYVSHYGRHGSRYLISDADYLSVMQVLEKAAAVGFLSEKGKDVYHRLESVWKDARGLGGQLTPLGYRQHREIAERMFRNFPEAFKGDRHISARSTVVIRCALSMATFCETLKGLNPKLQITYGSGDRYMNYLNYWNEDARNFTSDESPWRENYRKFRKEHIRPERLMKLLFTNQAYVEQHINAEEVMIGLYWIASDMQTVDLNAL